MCSQATPRGGAAAPDTLCLRGACRSHGRLSVGKITGRKGPSSSTPPARQRRRRGPRGSTARSSADRRSTAAGDRKSVGYGKRVTVRVGLGGRRNNQKKKSEKHKQHKTKQKIQ